MNKLKKMFYDTKLLYTFYEILIAVIYVTLIILSALFAFYNFVIDAGWAGFYWAGVCIYWIVNYAGRSAKRELNNLSDDDLGDYDDEEQGH